MTHRLLQFLVCISLLLGTGPAFAAERPPAGLLQWNRALDRVRADLEAQPWSGFLERLASVTGWDVFVEPGMERTVSVRFHDLPVSAALERLLSGVNYAVLPGTNGATRLYIFRTSVQEASQKVAVAAAKPAPSPESPKVLGKELIVTLKKGAKIDEIAKAVGAQVVGKLDGMDAYRLRFSDENAAQSARGTLAANDGVASVENNYLFNRPTTPELLAYSSNVPLNLKPKPGAGGGGLVVGLVDTAVQVGDGRLKDFVLNPLTATSDPVAPGAQNPNTQGISHGTAMAETILRGISMTDESKTGTAIRILPVDVYGAGEYTSSFDVARGIITAVREGATVVNLSLSSDAGSPILQRVVQAAHQQGVILVAAAGNEPVTAPMYPAAYPEVLAVTAGDRSGRVATYANRGDFVDVIAPGAGVVQYQNQSYLGTGTSFSSAFVSGLAAGASASSGKTLSAVEEEIRRRLAFKPPAPIPGANP